MKKVVKRGRPVGSSKKNADFMNLPYGGIPSDKLISTWKPELVKMDNVEYQLGDKYSSDFDYDGMLQKGIDSDIEWPVEDLQLLYKSFEDVNYHKEASYLYIALYELTKETPNIESVKMHIKMFNIECKKTKTEF